ncbi:protein prenylyltransferase [Saitoella complicata NRRL Y-17804]|uniref:Tetratricopeptide repeat protein 7 N-terminal domain-containing protein n=1 Tax=Saitoella complicata (strain BCRC 22490 / CBS 7301 / JCM 7358 / NBRC 10748 / NRRL Y-17804) TaxID=698492 RepID=A0A0E9NJY6_SAICN|nr:protein prenylyltransferase [Saitoella complicata NRRL Y-17804]ODQ54515.1 protein prenylyltransferase [Saitoella complicata NRRL Y-17804]GAO50118.1 hypothetical protein G7K_4253-t1 [Saitoella complicata NRRL Y-17804]
MASAIHHHKAVQYAQQLETARCSGNWTGIAELARKLQKHDSKRVCVARTAVAEASLEGLLEGSGHQGIGSSESIGSKKIAGRGVEEVIQQLKGAMEESGTETDKHEASIVLAQAYLALGQYSDAARACQHELLLQTPVASLSGYRMVSVMKCYGIYGMAKEGLGEDSVALEVYTRALQHLPVSEKPAVMEVGVMETILYRKALLTERMTRESEPVIQSFERYRVFVATTCPKTFRLNRRANVYRHYYQYLSAMLQQEYAEDEEADSEVVPASAAASPVSETFHSPLGPPAPVQQPAVNGNGFGNGVSPHLVLNEVVAGGDSNGLATSHGTGTYSPTTSAAMPVVHHITPPTPTTSHLPPTRPRIKRKTTVAAQQIYSRLLLLSPTYEDLLHKTTTFPRAGFTNTALLSYLDLLCSNWSLHSGSVEEAEGIVEVLYRATGKTFQSVRVLRWLRVMLERLGRWEEGARAVEAYVDLVEKGLERHPDAVAMGLGRVDTAAGGEVGEREGEDMDTKEVIVGTVADGARMVGKYLQKGKDALMYAEKARMYLEKWGLEGDAALAAKVWRVLGVAHGLWSEQTIESEERTVQQQKAIQALQRSLDYEQSAETFFHISLQLAVTRAIPEAITAVKQALHHDKHLLPAWHLLALLLSARKENEKALRICETAFQLMDDTQTPASLGYEEKETLSQLKITECALYEAAHGIEAAIERQGELFELCARMSITGPVNVQDAMATESSSPLNPPPKLELNGSSVVDQDATERASLMSSRRSIRSMLGRKRENKNRLSMSNSPSLMKPSLDIPRPQTAPPKHNEVNEKLPLPNQSPSISNVQVNPTYPGEKPSLLETHEKEALGRCLLSVWLASAGMFRRAGKFTEAHAAVREARRIKNEDPDALAQLGMIYHEQGEYETACTAFEIATAVDMDHPVANACLARTLLALSHADQPAARDRAEGLLDVVTKLRGWDIPEAWFDLAEIYEQLEEHEEAESCLWYCVDLENTRPVRRWESVVPRWV